MEEYNRNENNDVDYSSGPSRVIWGPGRTRPDETRIRRYNTGPGNTPEWRVINPDGSLGPRVADPSQWQGSGRLRVYNNQVHGYEYYTPTPSDDSASSPDHSEVDEAVYDYISNLVPEGRRDEFSKLYENLREAQDKESFDVAKANWLAAVAELEKKRQAEHTALVTSEKARFIGWLTEVVPPEFHGQLVSLYDDIITATDEKAFTTATERLDNAVEALSSAPVEGKKVIGSGGQEFIIIEDPGPALVGDPEGVGFTMSAAIRGGNIEDAEWDTDLQAFVHPTTGERWTTPVAESHFGPVPGPESGGNIQDAEWNTDLQAFVHPITGERWTMPWAEPQFGPAPGPLGPASVDGVYRDGTHTSNYDAPFDDNSANANSVALATGELNNRLAELPQEVSDSIRQTWAYSGLLAAVDAYKDHLLQDYYADEGGPLDAAADAGLRKYEEELSQFYTHQGGALDFADDADKRAYDELQQQKVSAEGGQYATGDYWQQVRSGINLRNQEAASIEAGETSFAPSPESLLSGINLDNFDQVRALLPDTIYRFGEKVDTDYFLSADVYGTKAVVDSVGPNSDGSYEQGLEDRLGVARQAVASGELTFNPPPEVAFIDDFTLQGTSRYAPDSIRGERLGLHKPTTAAIPAIEMAGMDFSLGDRDRFEAEVAKAESDNKIVVVKEAPTLADLAMSAGQWAPAVGVGLAAIDMINDDGFLSSPSKKGRMGIEAGLLALDVLPVTPPFLDAAIRGAVKATMGGWSVIRKQPLGATMQGVAPNRFSGFGFASPDSLATRNKAINDYLLEQSEKVRLNNPEHWAEVLRASRGHGYTIDNMNLLKPLQVENLDAVAMLKARETLSRGTGQGQVTTVPTLSPDVSLVAYPTPWQVQRPGTFLHGTPDVTPFMAGGPLPVRESIVQRGYPGQLGLYGAPDKAVIEVLGQPYDAAARAELGPNRLPGYIELPESGLILPPKLSRQHISRTTPISIRDLEFMGPSGAIVHNPITPPPFKRHRSTVVPMNEKGEILLVKGTKDNLWMLPGGT